MREESAFSFKCVVCNKQIHGKQKNAVALIRRHCQNDHPETQIWNTVEETRPSGEDVIDPVEHVIHQALRSGATNGPVPTEPTDVDFYIAFTARMQSSIKWVEVNAKMSKNEQLYDTALARMNGIFVTCRSDFMESDTFADETLERRGVAKTFNELMLFFVQFGYYKRCDLFPSLKKGNDDIDPVEHVIYRALKSGATNGPVPTEPTDVEFYRAFTARMQSSIKWVELNANKSQNRQPYDTALARMNGMFAKCRADFVESDTFADETLERHGVARTFNELMLFFGLFGYYKRCDLFPSLKKAYDLSHEN